MKTFVSISIGLATSGLAIGYALNALWIGVTIIVALGLLWLVGQWRSWRPVSVLVAILFIFATAFGVWQGVPAAWMLFSIVTTLVAWDLGQFTDRLEQTEQIVGESELKRIHLQRLLVVAGLGFLFGGIALRLQVELNLGWGIFLGLLAIVGLSRIIGFLRRESD
jgi:hypothetical protein